MTQLGHGALLRLNSPMRPEAAELPDHQGEQECADEVIDNSSDFRRWQEPDEKRCPQSVAIDGKADVARRVRRHETTGRLYEV
jgi:hypothetical protein